MMGAHPPRFMPPGGMPQRGLRPPFNTPPMQTVNKPDDVHEGTFPLAKKNRCTDEL